MKLDCRNLKKLSKDKYRCLTLSTSEMSKQQTKYLCNGCTAYNSEYSD